MVLRPEVLAVVAEEVGALGRREVVLDPALAQELHRLPGAPDREQRLRVADTSLPGPRLAAGEEGEPVLEDTSSSICSSARCCSVPALGQSGCWRMKSA